MLPGADAYALVLLSDTMETPDRQVIENGEDGEAASLLTLLACGRNDAVVLILPVDCGNIGFSSGCSGWDRTGESRELKWLLPFTPG